MDTGAGAVGLLLGLTGGRASRAWSYDARGVPVVNDYGVAVGGAAGR